MKGLGPLARGLGGLLLQRRQEGRVAEGALLAGHAENGVEGVLRFVPTGLGDVVDRRVVAAAETEEHVETIGGEPQAEARHRVELVEEHRDLVADGLGSPVVPDLARPQIGAADVDHGVGGAVGEQYPRALAVEAPVGELVHLGDAGVPLFLELVARRLRVGVADAPETLDEGVALVVLAQPQKGVELAVANQQLDFEKPLLVGRRQPLGERLALFAVELALGGHRGRW